MDSDSKAKRGVARAIAIWLLVFAGGWFVMLTELVGARVLAPYFGNTIYVWGSVIAIFLLALAVGYAIGGRMTQRFYSPLIPTYLAMLAGAYVAVTPFYQDLLCAWLYNTGLHVKWGALFATAILYGLPMALLGGVSPYCIQIATKTQLEVGNRAGALYAISTIGSFIGCLITAFVLIPGLPLAQISIWGGVALAAISIIVALVLRDRIAPAAVLAAVSIAVLMVGVYRLPDQSWRAEKKAYQYPLKQYAMGQVAPERLQQVLKQAQVQAASDAVRYGSQGRKSLLEMETPYHHISVLQEGPMRQLIFGKSGFYQPQTAVDLRNLNFHTAEYTHMCFAGLLFRPAPKRVCVIGIGGAVIPRSLELCAPGVKIDAIDIDPEVIQIAKEYFFWRPSRNVRVFPQDGRSFINWSIVNRQPLYDWIIIDAYNDNYVPFHLTTREFVYIAQRMLAPDGVMAANMYIDDDLYGCEARTFEAVFGNVTALAGHRSGNVILVSQNGRSKPLTMKEAAAAAMKLHLPSKSGIDPRFLVSCLTEEPNWSKNGPTLSDTWAPVENLMK
ncbi:MAG: fused MFS/spermidine synthase [Armatimonadota bacterium]|nr:fused MFS/spermidine synthase [Armatimonadota bacterium]